MPPVLTRDLTNQTDLAEHDTQLSKVSNQFILPDNIQCLLRPCMYVKTLFDHIILKIF